MMIYCVGRNYAEHAKELGNKAPGEPIIFFKPPASIVKTGEKINLPKFSNNVQFEAELAIFIGVDYQVTHFTIACDFTARDQQKTAKQEGLPWSLAKGFKQSCGLGPWLPVSILEKKNLTLQNLELRLYQNNEVKQHGFTKDMVFSIDKIISHVKENFPLEPGDIILTGTPSGVSSIKSGDYLLAEIVGIVEANWQII
ncbi:MAG: fumarylacetoacetate hydrolase family protein [Oligoflexia bacterium]|nr:fumarylacetoacetate hydrolase family protein [Oligoflexia bacterium]